jgi:hypothetical protein
MKLYDPGPPDETARRAIFAELIALQDRGVPVAESRGEVGRKFGVSPAVVRDVETEGLEQQWPPLGD